MLRVLFVNVCVVVFSVTSTPSTVIIPLLDLAIVVSLACPRLIAVNCGLSPVASPKSPRTSVVLLLSNPLAVNLANSSSATLALSIFTAFVLLIPKVKLACAPMSDKTSEALLPSIEVPSILKKSLSTAPEVKVATFPLDIPALGISLVSATVPALLGKAIVTSAVLAGPCNVTALVPLSVPSKNFMLPPVVVLPAPKTIL